MWGSAKSPKQNKTKHQKPKTHLNNPPTSLSERVKPVNKQKWFPLNVKFQYKMFFILA